MLYKIRKEIDEVGVPEEDITYDAMYNLLNSIKKLFTNINDIAKKSIPKFQKELQSEIKELSYITRKLGNKQKILDEFLRKKYTDLKDAEQLLEEAHSIKYDHELSFNKDDLYVNLVISFDKRKAYLIIRDYANDKSLCQM